MFLLTTIDRLLNSVTMYRLVLYGLAVLAGASIILGFTALLPFSAFQLILTLSLIAASSYLTQVLWVQLFKVVANMESWLITALILYLVIAPVSSFSDIVVTIVATVVAISSKFIFAIHKKHIFNPIAIALVLLSLVGFGNGIWWVGSRILLLPVTVVGLLIVRKIRRFSLLGAFLVSATVVTAIFNFKNDLSVTESFSQLFLSWPVVFFGTIMLTEPLTTPPTHRLQLIYGLIVGLLFGSQFRFGPVHSSPELALVIGNVFAFLVSMRKKLELTFKHKLELARNTYEFVFAPDQKFDFKPGQFLEWTLGHPNPDDRGNRRYFTIASSPTESEVKLGIRFNERSSSFKQALQRLNPGDKIYAGQLAGDFTLPNKLGQGVVFIAGGIGITPFRSMLQFMADTKQKLSGFLFYANNCHEDVAYQTFLDQIQKKVGLKTVYVLTDQDKIPPNWSGETGYLTSEMIIKYVPDWKNYLFYLSGPNSMVDSYKELLQNMRVSKKSIVTDYFPGF